MFLTTATDIHDHVSTLLGSSEPNAPVFVAVAFWGAGSESLFAEGANYRLICNLSHPGTNPSVIRSLASRHEVKQLATLHAKVFVGPKFALVGSANLSGAALGFAGPSHSLWSEAVVRIEMSSETYSKARNWITQLWCDAGDVTEDLLRAAEDRQAMLAVPDKPQPSVTNAPPGPLLTESLMFSPNPIEGGDRIRMASGWMNDLFGANVAQINQSNIRVPAFVANLLWTLAGNTISTGIRACPKFTLPDQVIYRATDRDSKQPRKNLEQMEHMLRVLADHADVPSSVRYWAKRWVNRAAPGCGS